MKCVFSTFTQHYVIDRISPHPQAIQGHVTTIDRTSAGMHASQGLNAETRTLQAPGGPS